jgi:hypothetical protein
LIRSFRLIIFIGLVLVSPVADGIAAGAFNINVLPREFVQIVERSPNILNVVGLEYWEKILDVSNAVENEGLMGVSEKIYLPLGIQRLIIEKVRTAAGVPEDVRFVLLDALTQYYVYTYYYDHPDPREKAFLGEHKTFLENLGVEFEWVEPAGENYYLHTFLRRLVREMPDTKWGRFYRAVEEETGLNDIPREGEGEEREFIFSPEVGLTIDAPGAGRPPSAEEIDAVRAFGRGKLVILAYKLAGLDPGAQARFIWMKFRVELTWALKSQLGGNR